MAETKFNTGWIVVGLGFLALAFTFAARSSVSMVIPLWETELGWTRTLSATGSSLVLAMMAAGSPVAGNLMDRHGPRAVFAFGLLALVAGVGGTAFATEPWHYLFLFGIVGGLGWASVSIPLVTAAVSACFDRNRGLAIGIAVSGATGGQLPVLSLLGISVAAMGWRSSFIGLAVLIASIALLVRFCLPAAVGRRPDAEDAPEADGLRDRLRFLFGQRTFLLLLAAFSLCGFTTAGVIDVHFIPYAISCGYSLELSTSAYGVHGLGNLAGVVLLSWAADHLNRPRLLATVFFVRAVLFVYLFQIGTSPANLYLFAAAFGFLNFAVFPIIANIVATHIGVRIIGLTLGLLFGGHSLGAAIGSVLGGWFFDLFAAYDLVWWLSLALAALAGVFAILIPETRPAKPRPVAAAA
jgi:MFS family permease